MDHKTGTVLAFPSTENHPKLFAKRFSHVFDAVFRSFGTTEEIYFRIEPSISEILKTTGAHVTVFVAGSAQGAFEIYQQLCQSILIYILTHMNMIEQTNILESGLTHPGHITVQLLACYMGEMYDLLGSHSTPFKPRQSSFHGAEDSLRGIPILSLKHVAFVEQEAAKRLAFFLSKHKSEARVVTLVTLSTLITRITLGNFIGSPVRSRAPRGRPPAQPRGLHDFTCQGREREKGREIPFHGRG